MKKEQSFATKIKEEICSTPDFSDERNLAILAGFLANSGSLKIHDGIEEIYAKTENAKIAKFIYQLIEKYFHFEPRFAYEKSSTFSDKTKYVILINSHIDEILDKLKFDLLGNEIDVKYFKDEQALYGYIGGAFLSTGSCNSPESSNYHLELSFNDSQAVVYMQKLVNSVKAVQYNMRISKRRNSFVLYLKKSDLISSFLVMIGAISSCMFFEDRRIERDFVNNDNRLFNLDGANFQKTLDSSLKQIENIEMIDSLIGIENIENDKLRELCFIRKSNKEANLQELADLLGNKLGFIVSKGNISHLFKKLEIMVAKHKKEINNDW